MRWDTAIEAFTLWQLAGGVSAGTVRLRCHYLHRLSKLRPGGPWTVAPHDLLTLLATPGWAPETRKSARAAVRAFYRWACDTEQIRANPAVDLPRIRIPEASPRPTPDHIVRKALADADDRGRLMILLALLAGLRRAEIARLHTDDLVSTQEGLSVRIRGKGGRVRVVPLHPTLAAMVADTGPGWVFPGRHGHLTPDHVGRLLGRLLGPGWSGHTLRHRFATAAYAVQRDLFAVQQLLGHSKPETTARYTAIPDGALRAAVLGVAA
jgi:integrase/recombinase XerC